MQNRNFKRPAEVKRWLDDLSELGSVIGGRSEELHHPIGESSKHRKLPVGMYWVLPLTRQQHRSLHQSHSAFEISHFGFAFIGRFDLEKLLFKSLLSEYEQMIGPPPIDEEIIQAIFEYHR